MLAVAKLHSSCCLGRWFVAVTCTNNVYYQVLCYEQLGAGA
jgi:hypothetical protein